MRVAGGSAPRSLGYECKNGCNTNQRVPIKPNKNLATSLSILCPSCTILASVHGQNADKTRRVLRNGDPQYLTSDFECRWTNDSFHLSPLPNLTASTPNRWFICHHSNKYLQRLGTAIVVRRQHVVPSRQGISSIRRIGEVLREPRRQIEQP